MGNAGCFIIYYLFSWSPAYCLADLETELRQGVLDNPHSADTCLLFSREIVDLKNNVSLPNASDYVDLLPPDPDSDHSTTPRLNDEAANRLERLRSEVCQRLPDENCHQFSVLWRHDEGISPELHKDYLKDFCERFETSMRRLIDESAAGCSQVQEDTVSSHWRLTRQVDEQTFVGRDDVIDVVKSYVTSSDRKPLVVHGEGGSGKTSVLARAATRVSKGQHFLKKKLSIICPNS